jgi:hypothetical protein
LFDALKFIGSVKPFRTALAACFMLSSNSIDAVIKIQEMLSVHKRTALVIDASIKT